MLYSIFRFLFQIIFVVFYRFEVKGHEHVPVSGPVIICSNHISNLDPPVVGSSMKRKVRFMAKEELFHIPVVSFLIRKFGTFPIKRGAIDKQGLRNALKLLKDGEVLGIFPEGTRSKSGELGQAFPGAAMFALKSQAPVIPVAIIGPYKPFKQLNIVIGKPIDLTRF
ncbi:MAG: lysophospholipid acyltransferase family protein, partial [Bacilli bacterium]